LHAVEFAIFINVKRKSIMILVLAILLRLIL